MNGYLEERSVVRRGTLFRLVTPNERRLLPIRESAQSFNGLAPTETVKGALMYKTRPTLHRNETN
jgi:hypothetical protein